VLHQPTTATHPPPPLHTAHPTRLRRCQLCRRLSAVAKVLNAFLDLKLGRDQLKKECSEQPGRGGAFTVTAWRACPLRASVPCAPNGGRARSGDVRGGANVCGATIDDRPSTPHTAINGPLAHSPQSTGSSFLPTLPLLPPQLLPCCTSCLSACSICRTAPRHLRGRRCSDSQPASQPASSQAVAHRSPHSLTHSLTHLAGVLLQ
jgi:hypothetical protein